MEEVFAGSALLIWRPLVGGDNRIANCTLGLTFEGADDVPTERDKPINDVTVL